ncbi:MULTISPECIES: APC family permease [Fusobacterium]|uniref:APC family permease n=1 Tax=Fusobacterium TaxID=848 RepID=UPI001476D182|nr:MULTISPECIES: APC family permease [Fusobacterium]NME35836.1 APC family permease [Fusobacterium sp. FSA-380-WT-3A]
MENTGTLDRKTLLAIGTGCVVGAGVVSLVGQAIGLTGYSAYIAYALAVVLGLIYNLPIIFASGAIKMDGGPYALISTILGKKFAGMYVVSFFLYFPTIAIYGVALGKYVNSLLPNVPVKLVALIVLTLFYVINLRGIDFLAKAQNIMTTLLVVGLITFALMGINKLNMNHILDVSSPEFFTNGPKGVLNAICVLMFSTTGQYYVIYFTRFAKNPKKDMPFAILGTTVITLFLYVSVTLVAVGVLPLDVVKNQPLTYVAQEILSKPLFIFFMISAPFMALATTINGCFAAYVEPIFNATKDGWFPEKLGRTNKKGNPWIILTLLWLASMLPIVLDWDINTIANTYVLVDLTLGILMITSVSKLPKLYPNAWAKREFGKHVSDGMFKLIVIMAYIVQAIIILNSLTSIKLYIIVITVVAFGTGIFYATKKEKDDSIKIPILEIKDED